ncbi:MAG: cyanophycin synthetase [bacterium]|nr:cyanophycin synthetase [bacterium]
MKKRRTTPLLGRILKRVAPKIGAEIVLEPEWRCAGQVCFRSGRKRYFRIWKIDINTMGASATAKDKGYANFFMARMGYPVVKGQTFFSDKWAKAIGSKRNIHAEYRYAVRLGLPVIVKPNSGSQGSGVKLAHTKCEFYRAMRRIFENDDVALVQRRVVGKDYRLVVLDRRLISAYQRIPLSVIGNGRSTILQLLKKKRRSSTADPRIGEKLARSGRNLNTVPPKGERVYLLDNANLSNGGESVDVTESIHPAFERLAVKLTKDMGLRLCGVDLMVEGDITKKPGRYWVLEINSAPGLDHYAKSGRAQRQIVEDLYLKVLRGMDH